MIRSFLLSILILCMSSLFCCAQKVAGHFVTERNADEFKNEIPKQDGPSVAYVLAPMELYDVNDSGTASVVEVRKVLTCVKGYKKDGQYRDQSVYVIDSFDHTRLYKIVEMSLINNRINGAWKIYNLKGTLIGIDQYEDELLNGPSVRYLPDGKTLDRERVYNNGNLNYTEKTYKKGELHVDAIFKDGKINGIATFYKKGIVAARFTYDHGHLTGQALEYYPDGKVMKKYMMQDGKEVGMEQYFYSDGRLWQQIEYKDGLHWNILLNNDSNGRKRDAGTLKNGNGTIIYYKDDGTVEETKTFVDGTEQHS